MSASLIQIKYSLVTAVPTTLAQGELAYSELSKKLFIGASSGLPVEIAGEDLVSRVGGVEAAVLAIQNQLGGIAADAKSAKDAVAAILTRLIAVEDKAAATAADLTALQGIVSQNRVNAETAIQAAKDQASASLQAVAGDINSKIDDLNATVQAVADTAAADLSTAVSSINTSVDAKIAAVDAKASSAKVDIGNLTTRVDDEVVRLDQRVDDLKAEVDAAASTDIAALRAKDDELQAGIDSLGGRVTAVEDKLSGSGSVTFSAVTISGDLVVQGTTTTVDSSVTTLKDPVITLGQGTVAADGSDRGIEYKYFDDAAGQVKTGFFGLDSSVGKFKFIPDATASGANAFEGDAGVIVANVEGSASKLAVARNIALSGDLSGSVAFDGASDVQIEVAVQSEVDAVANSIARRDATGGLTVTSVTASNTVSLKGGADGAGSVLTNFRIHGGTF